MRALVLAIVAACAAPRSPAPSPWVKDVASHAPLTVVTFFSRHCPCQAAHDARLVGTASAYAPKGVQFVAVDAEVTATKDEDAAEHDKRGYPFPLVTDASGATADALGAVYATYTVLLDRDGNVLYAGGLDSDRTHLTDDADRYLERALDDALAARPIRTPHGKVLGCALSR